MVKNPPTRQETRVQSLGWKDPLEKEMANHSSILAWEILCTEKSGRLVYRDVKGHGLATKQQLANTLTIIFASLIKSQFSKVSISVFYCKMVL